MVELFGIQLGTVFQGGTFAVLLTAFIGVAIAYIRGWGDRKRATTADDDAVFERMKIVEANVNAKLKKCEEDREKDAVVIEGLKGEVANAYREATKAQNWIFRCKLALDMTLDELLRKDPENEVIPRAKAVMMIVAERQEQVNGK